MPQGQGCGHQATNDESAENDDHGDRVFLEIVVGHPRTHHVQRRQVVRVEGVGRPIFVLTGRLVHRSFSLKRQQIIKPCRVQPDRYAFNAIGTVFNTFWPRLATVFFGFNASRAKLCSGFAVTTCKKQQPEARRPVKRDALQVGSCRRSRRSIALESPVGAY
ncbi:hypothetical protein MES5069_310120 [Mesorhizobium escarrei]|uniref:Uncharacterized protein n=1 Tax=Mesorhizobium escarrei TaxID=666018 RepID=A0ABM9E007_9HYPH|nr:hypothetical protein MES5069_310120 [Mesorhizobium escarrei]